MLTGRYVNTFTTDLQNCYQTFDSFATLANLLPGLAILLPDLEDLLRKY